MTLQESKGPEPGAEDISPSPEVPVTQDAQTPATQTRLRFPSLLSGEPPATRTSGETNEARSWARDLNLDQIVAAVAGDREERDLINAVLFRPLHDAETVRPQGARGTGTGTARVGRPRDSRGTGTLPASRPQRAGRHGAVTPVDTVAYSCGAMPRRNPVGLPSRRTTGGVAAVRSG